MISNFPIPLVPEVWKALLAAMQAALGKLIQDEILEQRAFYVVQVDLTLVADSKQGTGHAGIIEIDCQFMSMIRSFRVAGLEA